MMALPRVERRSQRCHAQEQERDHQRRGDVLIPLAANCHRQPVGNIVVRAKFDLVDEAAPDRVRGTSPASNRNDG